MRIRTGVQTCALPIWPQERHELSLPDRQRDVVERSERTEATAEALEPQFLEFSGMNGHALKALRSEGKRSARPGQALRRRLRLRFLGADLLVPAPDSLADLPGFRSKARRAGQECVSTGRSRSQPYP